jgi:hypothetical protein
MIVQLLSRYSLPTHFGRRALLLPSLSLAQYTSDDDLSVGGTKDARRVTRGVDTWTTVCFVYYLASPLVNRAGIKIGGAGNQFVESSSK